MEHLEGLLLIYLFIWAAFAIAVATLALHKGRNGALWLLYGLLLCPIAVVHAVFARSKNRTPGDERQDCPYCQASIPVETRTCRHCHQDLPGDWAATWRRG